MTNQSIIKEAEKLVRRMFSGEATGHDWWHAYRVWQLAKRISKTEKANLLVVELAAILHDLADFKFHGGDDKVGIQKVRNWLKSQKLEEDKINTICDIISNVSFKGAKVKNKMTSLEGKIVQDADRLDAIGAIGIARTFAFGASRGQEIYNPEIKPKLHSSFKEYKNSKTTTFNHFYEKLLLLRDRLHTQEAKKIALERHEFMELFLGRFLKEWKGEL